MSSSSSPTPPDPHAAAELTLADVMARLDDLARRHDRPLDARALQARGYTEQEAYGLLRRHGIKLHGGRRKRIHPDVLARIERGEIPA